jgi:6-phosphofructokinase 1
MSLEGNVLIGQSGGPTSVINGSLYSIITEAKKYGFIGDIYGAIHGIEGVLNKQLIDLRCESDEIIKGLTRTPGAALGGCRHKVQDSDLETIFKVFDSVNIKYFFYIGGNDSMDTADRLNKAAVEQGYELCVIGVPKTIDNDLPLTHHCPGFGSCAKYVATSVREAGIHTASMYTSEPVTILQTVGRNTGWLPGASALAKSGGDDAPHLIYFPENPFDMDKFLEEVERTYKRIGGAFIVVGEGLKSASGDYIQVQSDDVATDAFGHPMLGGVSELLRNAIESNLKIKARNVKLDICQQAAMHFASRRDVNDAMAVGKAGVLAAVEGLSGFMVTLLAEEAQTGLAELARVANVEREVPREWINEEGNFVTTDFLDYARPLIQGEVKTHIENGLPVYVKLRKEFIEL